MPWRRMVSAASAKGQKTRSAVNLSQLVFEGFGISNAATFRQATQNAKGAIIGSAFIKYLSEHGPEGIPDFIKMIRP